MSFGRPGFTDAFKPSPPARGSFPLDHDGECKSAMIAYMKCMKENANDNGKCRLQSKKYLECRMDNGLMQRDSMENLGLGDVRDPESPPPNPTHVPQSPVQPPPASQSRQV
ncbi:cytochrome c oxidase assembly protein COX19 [Cryptococcus amylolentus CBS 6039]|uniref:Cytochrome c oxidase assembly protein COX19 n=2 Tax=Cryptococcus amylolentus TaxID=104669 RepID=A0A1E3HT63_9TREE|nr:cytochrome c oxidase assembly protein COX19 [Cryptococcus amylolentus CBS 6039]ODN79553.1 cytochrome c oxidase assembly protein COX19 [Cryptococcus amylolentus CBS 6039]ODO07887.1 cytochrome c oxidase assembly protein COX19 [Cryptococcus amylolentus CBS 6273]